MNNLDRTILTEINSRISEMIDKVSYCKKGCKSYNIVVYFSPKIISDKIKDEINCLYFMFDPKFEERILKDNIQKTETKVIVLTLTYNIKYFLVDKVLKKIQIISNMRNNDYDKERYEVYEVGKLPEQYESYLTDILTKKLW